MKCPVWSHRETRPGVSCEIPAPTSTTVLRGGRSLTIWTGNPSESKRVVAHPGDCDVAHGSTACLVAIMVKLLRAHGGCLGASRRRRTWLAAKSPGEPLSRL